MKRKRVVANSVAVCLIIGLTLVLPWLPTAPTASAEGQSKYTIDATIDYQHAVVDAKETVAYTNRTAKALSSIVFNVTPAHFHAFRLKSAQVDGDSIDAKMDDVVMELQLAKPLEPRATAQIDLEYTLDVPQQGGRFGMNEKVLALGNWFPILSVYRDGWDRHRYHAFGDPFFTEVADYDVTLNISADVKLAHSGEIVSHDGNVWHLKASKIRDFALAMSDRYETRTVDVGDTTITVFYLPEHRPAGAMYLDIGAQALKFLGDKLGAFPHKSYELAETVSASTEMVGQEYSDLVFISSAEADRAGGKTPYLAYLVAHETVHQWFYSEVGNDQINDPWMDEALATFLGYQVLDWPPLTAKSPAVLPAGDLPASGSIYDYGDDNQYSAAVYAKGAMFHQDLFALLKSDNYYKMLRHYLELYRDKVATPQDFFSVAQSYSPTNLNSLIRKYFNYPEYKSDTTLKLTVNWPAPAPGIDAWQGTVPITYEAGGTVRNVTVDADKRVIYTQDSPTSTLSVDTSGLEDDEYLMRVVVRDDAGHTAQAVQRVKTANPKPAPKAAPATAAKTGQKSGQPTRANGPAASGVGTVNEIADAVREFNLSAFLPYLFGAIVTLLSLLILVLAVNYIRRPTLKMDYQPRIGKKTDGQAKVTVNSSNISVRKMEMEPTLFPSPTVAVPSSPAPAPSTPKSESAGDSAPQANASPSRYERGKYEDYGLGELGDLEGN